MLAESFGRGDYCTKQIINNKKPNWMMMFIIRNMTYHFLKNGFYR